VIKPLYNQARANMQVKVSEMNQIINDGKTIQIVYHAANGRISNMLIRPLVVVANAMEEMYYVVTIQNQALLPLRLDRIHYYEISKEQIEIEDLSPLEQLANIWGMETGESVDVKLMILNEANVQSKIQKELANRTNAKWTWDNDVLYFEDKVIGINNFRSWLNSYGSSVLVIEPQSLREEIIESAKKRIEYYK
jgi:predicted DNA-binding transcriptional regulator YafY